MGRGWAVLAVALVLVALAGDAALAQGVNDATDEFPPTLHEAGLYAAGQGRRIGTGNVAFSPQYTR